jgi:pseudaminic acid biosynthesis-associated methylase
LRTKSKVETDQIRAWTGSFGRDYTERNQYLPADLDALYLKNHGVSRQELNGRFLQDVPRDARILEVGCNTGNQLLLLHQMGFTKLHGIEIQGYAIDYARQRLPAASLVQASALAIPYKDRDFDLVFTSGVLIHIAPADLPVALDEIHRCAKTWIWGLEYYAPVITEVVYRGTPNLLWKTDYAQTYLDSFSDIELVREERLRYLENEKADTMFLLHRKPLARTS